MNQTIPGMVLDGSGALAQTATPITMAQGEYVEITVAVTDQAGVAFDLTGFVATLCIRKSRLTTTAIVNRENSGTLSSTGVILFKFTRVDTYTATPSDYIYDVYVTETATEKDYRVVPERDQSDNESIWTIEDAIVNLDDPVTPAADEVAVIGVPLPLVEGEVLGVVSGELAWVVGGGGGSGDMTLASVQTVTGAKTFQAGTLKVDNAANTFAHTLASSATTAKTWTIPDATDTAVGKATTDTLTNKTIVAPTITGTGTFDEIDTTSMITPTVGPSLAQQHTLPSVASSTVIVASDSRVPTAPGTQGSVYYDSGTVITKLSPGTSGQVLSTQGASANPQWITIAGSPPQVEFSTAKASSTMALSVVGGSFTLGQKFLFTSDCTVTGGKIYWNGSSSKTIKITLRTTAGAVSQSGTVAVTTAGYYAVTFGTPVSVPAFAQWSIGAWENTGTNYYQATVSPWAVVPAYPIKSGPNYWITFAGYGAGDAVVDTAGGINSFSYAEPVFTCP